MSLSISGQWSIILWQYKDNHTPHIVTYSVQFMYACKQLTTMSYMLYKIWVNLDCLIVNSTSPTRGGVNWYKFIMHFAMWNPKAICSLVRQGIFQRGGTHVHYSRHHSDKLLLITHSYARPETFSKAHFSYSWDTSFPKYFHNTKIGCNYLDFAVRNFRSAKK